MAATSPASAVSLDYRVPRLRTRAWSKWWAPTLFQLGAFGTTVAVLSLRDARAPNGPLPAWFTAGDLPIFCWITHSIAFLLIVRLIGGLEAVLRGPFRCVMIGMLYPLVLAGGVRLCAAVSGEAEGAAIALLSLPLAVGAGLLMLRESPDGPSLSAQLRHDVTA